MLQLAWLSFLLGAFYSYTLVESAKWSAGNFTWSGNITAFTLFVGSVVFWLRQLSVKDSGLGSFQLALLCGTLLAFHVLSGARLDWSYLTHYGCALNFRAAEFVCAPW